VVTERKSATPIGLGAAGRRLWRSLNDEYDFEAHERLLLLQACRTSDMLDVLASAVAEEGVVDAEGEVSAAAREMRQQGIALARLLAALRLPAGEEGAEQLGVRRPQRRIGVRGVYGPRPRLLGGGAS
jgi:hypothetical protein